MKKKLVAGAVTLLSVVTLAACANGTNKDIVTMKGGTRSQFLISIMKSKQPR